METYRFTLPSGEIVVVDAADEGLVSAYRWHARPHRRTTYVRANTKRADGSRGKVYLHHLVMGTHQQVDHINHDGLDNRRSNLRLATGTQNQGNQQLSKSNSSGYKGVYYRKRSGRWEVRIKLDGGMLNLGSYGDPWDAAQAYNAAAVARWGEFASLNVKH